VLAAGLFGAAIVAARRHRRSASGGTIGETA
jgi:hypothetical protein